MHKIDFLYKDTFSDARTWKIKGIFKVLWVSNFSLKRLDASKEHPMKSYRYVYFCNSKGSGFNEKVCNR